MKIRRLRRIIIVLQILMLILPTLTTLASGINIGDTVNISRGELGFYSIQYWNEYRNKWMYITYSRTYYTDTDGSKKIAYCMDPDLDGVGWLPGEDDNYDTEVKYEIEDEKIWIILKNGYPNVTPEALGVETEDDAYIATKQAVYWIIRNRDKKDCNITNIYTHFRAGETEINNQNLEDIQRRGKKVIDAIYKLVDISINNTNEVKKEPEIVDAGDLEPDADTSYYSKKYRITDTGLKATVKITKVKCQDDQAFITDEKGNMRTEFAPGETFKIMVHKDKIMATEYTRVSYTEEVETYPIYYTASKIEGKQNYVILLNKNKEKKRGIIF